MSTHHSTHDTKTSASVHAVVCRRQKGADRAQLENSPGSLEIDRDLPRPPHGAKIRITRTDEDSGRVLGYELLSQPGAEIVAGRVDKRAAQTFLQVESAIRDGSWALDGADELAHGQFVRAQLESGRATVLEVLGDLPDAALRIASIIDEFQLPTEFPPEVLRAAEQVRGPVDLLPRIDLRNKPFVTIDGADAKDFDDAVLAERRGLAFRLYVAIADVTAHVEPGGLIDQEARARGTSTYFPGRVLPMLPHRLSDNLCSLRPDEDRAVLVCEMQVSSRGDLQRSKFYPALIRSQARLIYGDVAQALETGDFPKAWNRKVVRNLRNLSRLHRHLHACREVRGALDFDSRDLQIELDAEGRVAGMAVPDRTVAHRLVEECMILANVAAARELRKAKQPFLARVHETPSAPKLEELRIFLAGHGLSLGGGDQPEPKDYADLLASLEEREDSATVQLAVLQSLQQAHYAPSDAGHFGLALQDYAHFTSPIRRYPDLMVHRALYAMLGGPSLRQEDWGELGMQCSELERRSDKASWGVIEAMKIDFLANKVGEEVQGTITGVTEFGLFVELDAYNISGLVHISQLGNDYFVYESERKVLRGRRGGQVFTLGQSLAVRIAAAEPASRKLDLVPASAPPPGGRRSSSKRKRRR